MNQSAAHRTANYLANRKSRRRAPTNGRFPLDSVLRGHGQHGPGHQIPLKLHLLKACDASTYIDNKSDICKITKVQADLNSHV
jgi:hypothetical protein